MDTISSTTPTTKNQLTVMGPMLKRKSALTKVSLGDWVVVLYRLTSTSATAVARRFKAVPPMVWSAFKLMEAKAKSAE